MNIIDLKEKPVVLHFTIGPVQDFISEARRLRDFWAGSFILSFLTGHAMVALKNRGAEIIFPDVADDDLFDAISGKKEALDNAPYVGSLPNRFKADISACLHEPLETTQQLREGIKDVAECAKQAVLDAWTTIADAVWEEYLAGCLIDGNSAPGNTPKDIWDRQVGNFWDIAYVAGPAEKHDGSWLDKRKNWRTGFRGAEFLEGGDHCRMMGQYQELSGYHRTIGEEKEKQNSFWEAVRKNTGHDLQENEYLCAIAFIKRFFPVLLQKKGALSPAIDWCPGGAALNIRFWPSTSYLAAVPWLKLLDENTPALTTYAQSANKAVIGGVLGETETRLFGLPRSNFFKLDGHLLHKDGIAAALKEKRSKHSAERQSSHVKILQAALEGIAKTIDPNGTKAIYPSSFYAILRMDGDNVGKMLGKFPDLIKSGLKIFTEKVKKTFDPKENRYSGVLVYAGGDDVLALLPVDHAIDAAIDLHEQYTSAFKTAAGEKAIDLSQFTLSGSIICAHFSTPLTGALRDSEHLLNDIAKKKNGRNSLAIGIHKRGGETAQWVSLFEEEPSPLGAMKKLSTSSGGKEKTLSRGFFHSVKANYAPLFYNKKRENTQFGTVDELDEKALLISLLLRDLKRTHSFESMKNIQTDPPSEAQDDDPYLITAESLGQLYISHKGEGQNPSYSTNPINLDAGLVVRFLNSERREAAK